MKYAENQRYWSHFATFSIVTSATLGRALTSRLLVLRQHHDEIVQLIASNFAKDALRHLSGPKADIGPAHD